MPLVNGADIGTAADLPDGGVFAQQPLRIWLRLPRYRRRHQTLPGPRQLFRCWRLHGGQLWLRLHLCQSRGTQVRLRLGGDVCNGELHGKQRLRIRLPLHQFRNKRRPVCLKSAIVVTALARTRIQRTPGRAPGVRACLRVMKIFRRAAPFRHTSSPNKEPEPAARPCGRAAEQWHRLAHVAGVIGLWPPHFRRSGPRVLLPSPRASRGCRHLLLDHLFVAAAERRVALPRLRTTSAAAEATYRSRRLVARLSKG
jgi:hypothetical protein